MRASEGADGGEIVVWTADEKGRESADAIGSAQSSNGCASAREFFAGATTDALTAAVWSWPHRSGAGVNRGAVDAA